jgi:hypothetical protein
LVNKSTRNSSKAEVRTGSGSPACRLSSQLLSKDTHAIPFNTKNIVKTAVPLIWYQGGAEPPLIVARCDHPLSPVQFFIVAEACLRDSFLALCGGPS